MVAAGACGTSYPDVAGAKFRWFASQHRIESLRCASISILRHSPENAMPIGLDPKETAAYILKRDREKPEASRPVFLFHYLTRAESRRVRYLRERAHQE